MQAFVIAAPASGSGKTTVTLALLAALRRRGLKVAPFKVGPDFIDPGHHAAASGRVSRNLDAWMCGAAGVQRSFALGCAGAEVAVIEGVMGLFDGADGGSEAGSTAAVAKLLNAPVILVIDAKGQARSVAALIKGFSEFDPALMVAGIILNRVASPRHAELLRAAHASVPGLPPLLGVLPREPQVALPERYLGLVTAEVAPENVVFYERLAEWFEAGVDVDGLLKGSSLPPFQGEGRGGDGFDAVFLVNAQDQAHPHPNLPLEGEGTKTIVTPPGGMELDKVRIAVARDEAFSFCYPENLELLEAAGAEIEFFSPLRNHHLPAGISGLYLPGGYPELYAPQLAANLPLLQAIRTAASAGMPIYAECGGLIYLSGGVDGAASDHLQPFVALFPAWARMLPQRKALGYRQVTFRFDTILGPAGTVARGHEFHYSEVVIAAEVPRSYALSRADGQVLEDEGYVLNNVLASYVHLHFASHPALAASLVESCRRWNGP
ncbi:MAG: cobyrinate a,c-diamide synthase [Desulfuromonadales bacterium]|nr:cobyrinate a,c-diamide synthase [Desulfuromonadales bacterium]